MMDKNPYAKKAARMSEKMRFLRATRIAFRMQGLKERYEKWLM
jgi:hypothetical protein